MRRKEFDHREREEIATFLGETTFGYLGTTDGDGYPHITPINFVYINEAIYLHGSKAGQKMRDMKRDERVCFSVAKQFAFIPSYFSDDHFACPATTYFKSVFIRGRVSIVDDAVEKAVAMTAFMHKLQPEGGYAPIDPDDSEYASRIKGVAVIKLNVEELSAKFKFGQNLADNERDNIISGLRQRGAELDEETARLMRKYCPVHKQD